MQALIKFAKEIDPKQVAIFAGVVALSWLMHTNPSFGLVDVIDIILMFGLPNVVFRLITGKWPPLSHPVGYLTLYGWVVFPGYWVSLPLRLEHLPPSSIIDIGLSVLGWAIALFSVWAVSRETATAKNSAVS